MVPVPDANVSITGTGVATGTGDANGQLCMHLGTGSYSTTVTYPSGVTRTLDFDVLACSTTSVTTTSITSVCFQAWTNAPGCTGTIIITNEDDGTILGSGTIATKLDETTYFGKECIPISEAFIGNLLILGYEVIWPNESYHVVALAACYSASTPLNADPFGDGC